MTKPIQILIVAHQPLIKEGIKQILSFYTDILIVGEGSNGQDALDLVSTTPCDILLLDINMPILNGLEVVEKLKISHPSLPILLLTVENDFHTLKEAIAYNINGYILKESAGSTLTNAIRHIHSGQCYIDPALTKDVFHLIQNKPLIPTPCSSDSTANPTHALSTREKEILLCISKGLTNKEIGMKLFLSEKTIRNYLTKIFKKIQVKDRVQATIFALEHKRDLSL